MCCKAFISVSEDPIVGAGQKGAVFKKKMYDTYIKISHKQAEYDRKMMEQLTAGTRSSLAKDGVGPGVYHPRTIQSIYARFKDKISPDVCKFMGVLDTTPKESGTTDEDHLNDCLLVYKERYGREFDFVSPYKYLKDKAKYTVYLSRLEDEEEAKKARPRGTKAARRAEQDAAFIKEAMSAAQDSAKSSVSSERKGSGMTEQVGALFGMAGEAIKSFIESQQQATLMQLLDTPEKKELAKAAAQVRLAELASKKRKFENENIPTNVGDTDSISSIDSP